jgi:hypothetical protein
MKLNAMLILLTIMVSIFSPIALHLPMMSSGPVQHFISLDVCNAAGAFISAGTEAPALPEYVWTPVTAALQEFTMTGSLSFVSPLFFSHIEQPPRS